MATFSVISVSDVYERLRKKFVDQVSEEDLKEGERLFFEHAGDEECHHHDHEAGDDTAGHDHCADDECDPEQENRNMKLPFYRAYWCKNLFTLQAGLVKDAFKVVTEKQVVDKAFFKQVKSVAGLGCGPASDLIGFMEFLSELPQEDRPSSTPALVGIDAEEGWGEYVVTTGCTFACQQVDAEFLKQMPNYDIIIMCCLASHMGFANEKSNMELIAEKCKFLVILDFDDPTLDAALKEHQFFRHSLPGKTDLFPGYVLNVHAKLFGAI